MKNISILRKLTIATLTFAMLLMVSPLGVSANGGEGRNKKDKENKIELRSEFKSDSDSKSNSKGERKSDSCLRAYGHLISLGWLKLNVNTDVGTRCWFPFGISKKFGDEKFKSDTVAPIISVINSETGLNKAVVSFNTDEKTNATVFYGSTAGLNLDNSATLKVSINKFSKEHNVKITNLSASTKYYFVIKSTDKNGNVSASVESNFTTQTPIVLGDTSAPVIKEVVAVSATSSVLLGWVTNEPATSKVFYGNTSPLNISSPTTTFVESTDLKTNHLVTVPNLSLNSKYYLVIQSKDAAGNIQSSTETSATTGM